MTTDESDAFLKQLYATNNNARAIDLVLDVFDGLLNDDNLADCNDLLAQIDLRRLPSSVRRAVLCITRPARGSLLNWASTYEAALRILSEERGVKVAKQMLASIA